MDLTYGMPEWKDRARWILRLTMCGKIVRWEWNFFTTSCAARRTDISYTSCSGRALLWIVITIMVSSVTITILIDDTQSETVWKQKK